jgi:hypothetical protein
MDPTVTLMTSKRSDDSICAAWGPDKWYKRHQLTYMQKVSRDSDASSAYSRVCVDRRLELSYRDDRVVGAGRSGNHTYTLEIAHSEALLKQLYKHMYTNLTPNRKPVAVLTKPESRRGRYYGYYTDMVTVLSRYKNGRLVATRVRLSPYICMGNTHKTMEFNELDIDSLREDSHAEDAITHPIGCVMLDDSITKEELLEELSIYCLAGGL